MAITTFSGPVASDNGFILEPSTTAALGAATNAINTTGKQAGKCVVVLASGKIYTATGSLATSTWVVSDGSTAVTPA